MPRIYKKCTDCGAEFFISEKAQEFFASKPGFVLPKRCFDCRKEKRAQKEARTAVRPAPQGPHVEVFVRDERHRNERRPRRRRARESATFGDIWKER